VFVSGCLGFDPKTGTFVEGGVEAQTRQALQNLKSIVEASGSQVGKIVKTTVRVSILLFDLLKIVLSERHLT
jgi:2-iminobutanoate/2-iminopropanoate deaminase